MVSYIDYFLRTTEEPDERCGGGEEGADFVALRYSKWHRTGVHREGRD